MLSRFACTFGFVLALLIVLAGHAAPVSAHAFLEASDPVAGAIMPVQPDEITLTFSERLEPDATSATLFDHLGVEIPGSSYRIANENQLIVALPPDLPNGTYSVVFQNISRDDGHPARGYLPFTIGSGSDLRAVAPPPILEGPEGAPEWLRTGSRWIAYTGLLLSLAIWPVWSIVIAPALRRRPAAMRPALTAVRTVAIIAISLAIIGNLTALIAQALERDDPFVEALESTLFDSRFGELWIMRVLLLGILATALPFLDWVRPTRRVIPAVAGIALSFALALPFSLISHASAQASGRTFAIAADLLHLMAAGLWGGGALLLTAVLWKIRRSAHPDPIRTLLLALIPRFSFVAIAAWIVLLFSGAYAAWLQIGNLEAARATDYGNAFLIKLGIAAVLLSFGATQFIIVTRRLRSAPWNKRLEIILFAESIGIVLILLITGWMTSAPPAREAFAQDSAGVYLNLTQNDLDARLTISPAAAGPNHFNLTFAGNAPSGSEATLRLSPPNTDFDQVELTLNSVGPNVWEAHGSQFSFAGDWSIEVVIRKAGEFQWQASTAISIATDPPGLPGQPWRFGLNAFMGLAMLVIGAVALARAVTLANGRSRKETAGIGLAGLAIGAFFLFSAQLEPPPSFKLADDATIARGSAIYAQQCMACHGVGGQGDGPEAAGLPVPPADFTDPIHQIHSDTSLAAYIQNGFPLSGMPAYADILSAGEIADVIAFIRSIGAGAIEGVEAPTTSECTIAPREVDLLINITFAATPEDPTPVEWPIGNPASSGQSESVAETVRQFIACSNAGEYERVLATSTLRYLAPQFAQLDDAGRAAALELASAPRPLGDGETLVIETIEPARTLPDGRLATRVITLDPVNHPHRLESILILAEEDGLWRIDEVHQAAPDPEAVATPVTWPLLVSVGDYTLTLSISDAVESGRPLRIDVEDAAGDSVDGASGLAVIVPRGVGVPVELDLANVNPGVYFAYAPTLTAGAYVIEVDLTLPDGEPLTAGFTFVMD